MKINAINSIITITNTCAYIIVICTNGSYLNGCCVWNVARVCLLRQS